MDIISQIVEAIKKLPVKCESFEDADKWVGVVIALESMLQTEEPVAEAKTLAEGE